MELLDKVEKGWSIHILLFPSIILLYYYIGEFLKAPLIANTTADIDKNDSNSTFQLPKHYLHKREHKSTLFTSEKIRNQKSGLSFYELFRVLLPYFWPAKGTDGAFINRIRSSSTWLMVIPPSSLSYDKVII